MKYFKIKCHIKIDKQSFFSSWQSSSLPLKERLATLVYYSVETSRVLCSWTKARTIGGNDKPRLWTFSCSFIRHSSSKYDTSFWGRTFARRNCGYLIAIKRLVFCQETFSMFVFVGEVKSSAKYKFLLPENLRVIYCLIIELIY